MSWTYRFLRILMIAVMLTLGLAAMANVRQDVWAVTSNLFGSGRFVIVVIGMIIWALALPLFFMGRGSKKESRYLFFDNEGGRVSISLDAIGDYVLKLASEFPSIIKMSPSVTPARNSIDVLVKLRVKAGPQIHEVCEVLQKRVRETIVTGLGIADVRRVEVSVTDIVSEHVQR